MQYIGLKMNGKVYHFNDFKSLAKVGDLVVVANLDDCTMGEVVEIKKELDFYPTKNLLAILDRKTVEQERESVNKANVKREIEFYRKKKAWFVNRYNEMLLVMKSDQEGLDRLGEQIDDIESRIKTLRGRLDD